MVSILLKFMMKGLGYLLFLMAIERKLSTFRDPEVVMALTLPIMITN
jgi:hypothetical protein